MPAAKKAARRLARPERPELRPDPENPNLGTKRGLELLETSFEQFGAMRSAVASADGVILAGNKSFETAREKGFKIREVETDGTELIVVRRRDLQSDDPRARAYKVADNQIAFVSLAWDPEIMGRMDAEGVPLDLFLFPDEKTRILETPPGAFLDAHAKASEATQICPRCGFRSGSRLEVAADPPADPPAEPETRT